MENWRVSVVSVWYFLVGGGFWFLVVGSLTWKSSDWPPFCPRYSASTLRLSCLVLSSLHSLTLWLELDDEDQWTKFRESRLKIFCWIQRELPSPPRLCKMSKSSSILIWSVFPQSVLSVQFPKALLNFVNLLNHSTRSPSPNIISVREWWVHGSWQSAESPNHWRSLMHLAFQKYDFNKSQSRSS